MNRRDFLKGILAAGIAPAIVKAANIMPVRQISDTGIVQPDVTSGYLHVSGNGYPNMNDIKWSLDVAQTDIEPVTWISIYEDWKGGRIIYQGELTQEMLQSGVISVS